MMVLMIIIGVGLKLFQEAKADSAAAKLKAMISLTATVLRDGKPQETVYRNWFQGTLWYCCRRHIPSDVRLVPPKTFS